MLESLKTLFALLDAAGLRYCHWKSNDRLAAALEAHEDIDLLVDAARQEIFETILAEQGYLRGRRPAWDDTPGTRHYYGLDEASGALVHIHAYFELITGGSILKNHGLPAVEFLLENRDDTQPIPTPRREADLVILVLRKMI